jgi:RNA polymerase sigma-70 factor, ECF subfamily
MHDWQAIFEEHRGPLYLFAVRLTGSPGDAEEIVQECFLSLFRSGGAYDPSRTALRSYLLGAVRNQALKRLRSREDASPDPPDLAVTLTPESIAAAAELGDAVARAVGALPLAQREVLILSHYEQLSNTEIAALLSTDTAAVKAPLSRARQSLKHLLAPWAPLAKEELR